MSRVRALVLAAALAVSACVSGPSEKDWTSNAGTQSFATAVAACNEVSYNGDANFTICMAGRGWSKRKG